jgi:hypothetical protein
MTDTFCIPNAPRQNGDLWVEIVGKTVKVMNPAGAYWRGKTFTFEEFQKALQEAKK